MEIDVPALTKIKIERIDEEESPCSDLTFPQCHTDTREYVNSYDSMFDISIQLKRDISEEEDDTSRFSHPKEIKIEIPTNTWNLNENDNSYDDKSQVLKQLKKEVSEEVRPRASYSIKNKLDYQGKRLLGPSVVDKEVPCEYNEESLLSVRVKPGDRKYQGKRKTERSENRNENTCVHYDTLVTAGNVSCKLCSKVFENSFNLLKHNIEHLRLDINTPDVIKKYREKHKSVKRPYNKGGVHKTKLVYHCKKCNKDYRYRSWHKHLETVHSQKKYKCGLCGKKFRCFGYVENHMKMVHVTEMYKKTVEYGKMYECWCGKEFRSQVYLKKHKRERHNMSENVYTPISLSFL